MARILLVDEDSPARTLTRSALRIKGHQVVEATTGEEALAYVSKHSFDVILLNLVVEDMDGYLLLEQLGLRTGNGGTPIITMSDEDVDVDMMRTAEAGALDHIRKPVGPGELDAAIARYTGANAGRVDGLRVVRRNAAELYKSSLELMRMAK